MSHDWSSMAWNKGGLRRDGARNSACKKFLALDLFERVEDAGNTYREVDTFYPLDMILTGNLDIFYPILDALTQARIIINHLRITINHAILSG
jgi:hypothetical protein